MISGDGCSVVSSPNCALDVFRDDDTGDRWDVYRARLPLCGGELGGWELVSTRTDGSTLARDDVSIVDPPAISRSGTIIAYTHPADHIIDSEGLTTISVVDVTVPIDADARGRSSPPVRRSPSPNTTFVHRGLDQPALSGDGRFLAYRSDAASADAVPGWGSGQRRRRPGDAPGVRLGSRRTRPVPRGQARCSTPTGRIAGGGRQLRTR